MRKQVKKYVALLLALCTLLPAFTATAFASEFTIDSTHIIEDCVIESDMRVVCYTDLTSFTSYKAEFDYTCSIA